MHFHQYQPKKEADHKVTHFRHTFNGRIALPYTG